MPPIVYNFINAIDEDNYPALPGATVAESIDLNVATFWFPQPATPALTTFQWWGDWGGASYTINSIGIVSEPGFEPVRIKVRVGGTGTNGKQVYVVTNPAWDYVSVPGYAFFDCLFSDETTTAVHLELKIDPATDVFHLNEVIASQGPYIPPLPKTYPRMIKRSPIGRESFKFPGRQKPRWSSYQETPEVVSDVV